MYKFILAIRYLTKRRITYLAVLAVAFCVFMVVVVLTVMTGLVRNFKARNHNWVGDCIVSSNSLVGFPYYEGFVKILKKEFVVGAVSPVIKSYGLLTYKGSDWNEGVEILGVEPARHSRVTGFAKTLYYHKDDVSKAFEPSYDANLPGCIPGIDKVLSRDRYGRYRQLPSLPEYSFVISCFPLSARGALTKAGLGLVNTKTFYYSDNSHSGLAKVDGAFVYLPFNEAQMLCGMGGAVKRVSAIHIKFKQGVKLQAGCGRIDRLWREFAAEESGRKQADLLNRVRVESWKSYRRSFIAAAEKEETMMIAAFGMIGIITVFIVLVVFYMIVSHKSKDIGILKSVGVSNGNILGLFLIFALLVGTLGSGIGVLGGWQFLVHINQIEGWLFKHFGFQLWDRTVYAIGAIPNRMDIGVLAVIVLSAIFACLVGALVPSWQAARLKPVETLQVSRL